jgi:putative PIN family toxin of toxin-antitoxin system
MKPVVVLDTNVLVAALRSRRGASYALLARVADGTFTTALSVPLFFEYEEVLSRPGMVPISQQGVAAVLDMLARVAIHQPIHYLWRPRLRDPDDEMVLELAAAAGARFIVTHNVNDFRHRMFPAIDVVTPAELLGRLPSPPGAST